MKELIPISYSGHSLNSSINHLDKYNTQHKSKAALNIKFARNRAEELDRVLEEGVNKDEPVDQEVVAMLKEDIKREIVEVRSRVENFAKNDIEVVEPELKDEDSGVFSANLSKEDDGYSLSETGSEDFNKEDVTVVVDDVEVKDDVEEEFMIEDIAEEQEVATNTDELGDDVASSSQDMVKNVDNIDSDANLDIFDEAGELLENEEYNEVLTKLDEVLLGEEDDGEVKGVSEVADDFLPEESIGSSTTDSAKEE